jgi:FKBP-type peptidyl-prolyl cis-trans isomerase (trigger factor)
MNPEVGFFITVEGLQISQDFFKEEYEQISKSYYSVMKKLDEYYKNSKQK